MVPVVDMLGLAAVAPGEAIAKSRERITVRTVKVTQPGNPSVGFVRLTDAVYLTAISPDPMTAHPWGT